MADKRSLFGMDTEDLADALESIYKKQKSLDEKLDQVLTTLLAMKTTVLQSPEAGAATEADDDGVPPLVKWALQQPWGIELMHGFTDQQMISGLVKSAIGWLQKRAEAGVKPPATEG